MTIGVWALVLIIAVVLIFTLIGDALTTDADFLGNPESVRADDLLRERFSSPERVEVTEIILVRSSTWTVDDPAFQVFAEGVFAEVIALGPEVIPWGTNFYDSGDESLVSLDGHTTSLVFGLLLVPTSDNYGLYFDAFPNPWSEKHSGDDLGDFQVQSVRVPSVSGGGEVVIVKSSNFTTDDSEYRQFIEDLFFDIVALGRAAIWSGANYYQVFDESMVSEARHATIMPFGINNSDLIGQVHNVIDDARNSSEFDITITGEATLEKDFEELSGNDLKTGELMFGLPTAIVVLILVFGAVAAALVPLLLAIVSIGIAIGLAMLFGQVFDVSIFLINMVFMMGLAVGIDYCLFIIARFREERARGREKHEAIERAGATASRAVLFSGITVVLALIGLLLMPFTIFTSLGLGAILVVMVSVAASLTLLPALLSLLGDRVNSLRIPFVFRTLMKFDERAKGGFWDHVSRTVMRFPIASILLGGGLLVAAAVSLLSINVGVAGVSTLPDSFESKKGFMALQEDFSAGLVVPTEIVIDGPIDDPAVQEGIAQLKAALDQDVAFGVVSEQVNDQRDLAYLTVPISGGDYASDVAMAAVKRLRSDYIPAAFTDVPAEALVTGETAGTLDYINLSNKGVFIVFPFVLALSFLLLTIAFRSLVVPVKAIIMNLLSVGAAYGLLVLVFQKGVAAGFFGFQQVETIEAWVPVFLFAVLFGLSMDYHVFLLSRVRERFRQTHDNTESVAYGIRSTGRLITGAALIMVAVFAGFASGDLVMFQQMGFGLAVAILLDATIVRSVLVPATMKLLGDKNWYLPSWLQWLPHFGVELEEEEDSMQPVKTKISTSAHDTGIE
jgi:RND superfamily putative drug exporter